MRRPFGGTGAEVMVDARGINGRARAYVYDAESGGVRVTDLLDMAGAPIAGGVLVAGANGKISRFLGPDDGRAALWLDAGFGRLLCLATDTADRLAVLEQLVAQLLGGAPPSDAPSLTTALVEAYA